MMPGNQIMKDFRHDLNFHHNFDTAKLDRAEGFVGDAIEHVHEKLDTKRGLTADNIHVAFDYLDKKHAGWKALSPIERNHIKTTLEKHLGVEQEPPAEAA